MNTTQHAAELIREDTDRDLLVTASVLAEMTTMPMSKTVARQIETLALKIANTARRAQNELELHGTQNEPISYPNQR